MADDRPRFALVCTVLTHAGSRRRLARGRGRSGRGWRHVVRTALAALALSLLVTPRASAYPIGIQFTGTVDYGTLAGTAVWGSFFWDDLGPAYLTAPITSLNVFVGSQQYDLSHGTFPAFVQSPHIDPLLGVRNDWGPRYQVRPEFLIGGLTDFTLFEGGNVFLAYSYLPGASPQYLTQFRVTHMSVPEPGTLALGLSALAGMIVRRAVRPRRR